jgi:hypothetical protein
MCPPSLTRSLLPSRLDPIIPIIPPAPPAPPTPPVPCQPPALHVDTSDSLTREKKGKMPALSHLLSVGNGRVLSLAADRRYVYAGCQSADNEIVVSVRGSDRLRLGAVAGAFQPGFGFAEHGPWSVSRVSRGIVPEDSHSNLPVTS